MGTLLFAVFLAVSAYAQTAPSVTVRPVGAQAASVLVVVDGKIVEIDSVEMQRGQHVMVALRDLEKLGWGVVESASPDRITFKANGVSLTFTKGRDTAMVNSLVLTLPIDTYLRDGKLMVPLSFVAKAIGFQYDLSERPVAAIATTGAVSTPSNDTSSSSKNAPNPSSDVLSSPKDILSPSKDAPSSSKGTGKTTNALQGTVLYDGSGVSGVIVRAVDPEFRVVKTDLVKTDANGEYKFENLPDGTYIAYVYVGDNPAFVNRASELIEAVGGEVYQVPPLSLVRVIAPLKPKPGGEVALPRKGSIDFAWSPCQGAEKYKLTIRKSGSEKVLAETTVEKPQAGFPASLFTKGSSYEVQVRAESILGELIGWTAGPGAKPWPFAVKK